jgi:hypothetical protein
VKNPAVSCGVSSKEKALMGVAAHIPRLPFIPVSSYRVFWLFPMIGCPISFLDPEMICFLVCDRISWFSEGEEFVNEAQQ